jgi:hypothetical protein
MIDKFGREHNGPFHANQFSLDDKNDGAFVAVKINDYSNRSGGQLYKSKIEEMKSQGGFKVDLTRSDLMPNIK